MQAAVPTQRQAYVRLLTRLLRQRADERLANPVPLATSNLPTLFGPTYRVPRLAVRWRQFRDDLIKLWETHQLIDHIASPIHDLLKKGSLRPPPIPSLVQPTQVKILDRDAALGVLQRLRELQEPERMLVDAIARLEVTLDDLVTAIEGDWLERELALALVGNSSHIPMADAAAVHSSVERSLILAETYSNHARRVTSVVRDYFLTDVAVSGFGDHFSKHHHSAIEVIHEANARRNVVLHQGRRIDHRYVALVPGTPYRIGAAVTLEPEYLRRTLVALRELITCAYGTVTQLYGGSLPGVFGRAYSAIH